MSQVARLGLPMTLALGLIVLLSALPAAANDPTCDHVISAPGSNTRAADGSCMIPSTRTT
jgi:hypothetical protein